MNDVEHKETDWKAFNEAKRKMELLEARKKESGDGISPISKTWDLTDSFIVVEKLEGVKSILKHREAGNIENLLSEIVDYLLEALEGCDKNLEQAELLKTLNKAWEAGK